MIAFGGRRTVFSSDSTAGGPARTRLRFHRLTVALLLAGTAIPARSATDTAAGSEASAAQPSASGTQRGQDIIVLGQLFRDVRPEHELDQQAIESYAVSTVGDLLDEVENELDDDQEPMLLVNGERVDVNDIGGFPVEALTNVEVLPRGSAVRIGGSSGQRVINLKLVRKMRSATATAAARTATEGNWSAGRGEGLLTVIQNRTRANLGLRIGDEDSLLESDRDIVQPSPTLPYSIQGNVIGFPDTSGEIDPLLSALAGRTVTVAPIPSTTSPSLASFAPDANNPSVTDLGRFRTLRPELRNYGLNGNFSTRLAPWLSGNFNFRLDRNVSHSSNGLPPGLFVLSPTNPASPFSTGVGLAVYGADPLRSRSVTDGGELRMALNGTFGRWSSSFNASHSETKNVYDTQRATIAGPIPLDDSFNPFASSLSGLIGITTDRSRYRSTTDLALLSVTGPLFELPAGPVQTTLEGRLRWYRLQSRSTFSADSNRNFGRDEQAIRGAIDLPITSRQLTPQIGDLSASAEYARVHFSDAGSMSNYGFGLTWNPNQILRMRASIDRSENAPLIQLLGSPVVETPGVRVFDPQTGETVDVTLISGGNPNLRPERATTRRVTALLRLVPRLNLQFNADYADVDARHFISTLPSASLPIMLAFPDRFIRTADGTLTTVDLRPVNFDSHREKRLRWGLSMRTKLGGGSASGSTLQSAESESAEDSQARSQSGSQARARNRSTFLELTANHTMVFSDKVLIRPGVDPVDLLGGGALGIGGGRVRHQVDGTAAISSDGLGARLGVTWRGASTLDASIGGVSDTLRFPPLLVMNLRLFAEGRRILPKSEWAKGLRLSLNVVNVTNDRQKVRDSFGNTPLQYQPAYRDPLGRTIEFEIRKVF
jgi:hypothetical protein